MINLHTIGQNLHTFGKFLDQPVAIAKFQKAMPLLLSAGCAAVVAKDVYEAKPEERKEKLVKNGITMAASVAAALAAASVASAITKRPLPPNLEQVKKTNKELIDTFVKNNNIDDEAKNLLEKGKEKILNLKEVKALFANLSKLKGGDEFLQKLIPDPENISAKDIFSEIGYLSVYGFVPVAGGITGGIIADRITDKDNFKKKIPDKIKEGSFQYLANIFMCNIGAATALMLLEKAGIQSKLARAAGMVAGIALTGVIGGSKIANTIGKYVIEPVCGKFNKKAETDGKFEGINFKRTIHNNVFEEDFKEVSNIKFSAKKREFKERKTEVLDLIMHTDDIATVAMLSGLKWIEPALPVLYTLSGYRAGSGYRN